jgi:UDP-N-acetylmuramoyl-tripeptide--D-alanyl-D-alanine ligase
LSWCAQGVTFARIKTNKFKQKRAPGGRATAKQYSHLATAASICYVPRIYYYWPVWLKSYIIIVIMFKNYIQKKLESYVKHYFRSHPEVKLVVVAGSVGKTTTKLAIGTVLSERFKVRLHEGNHNSEISAPLAILGIDFPASIRNPILWLSVFRAARLRISQPADVDVIIQELGSDGIGQLPQMGMYLIPDIAVITAVSPEHMSAFVTIEDVAKEELSAANFSRSAIINRDDIAGEYAKYLTNANISTYGLGATSEYYFQEEDFKLGDGYNGKLVTKDWDEPLDVTLNLMGQHSIRAAVAAAAVAIKLGLNSDEVRRGLNKIIQTPGRMSILRGVEDSSIIDDTYNSSPLALAAAIKTLYSLTVPSRIAVIGSMNELGATSAVEHQAIGRMCDPNQLAWVITVGDEAEKYLAPAARQNGCQVKSFISALEAGAFVHRVVEPGAAVLFKGSQDKIYLEEAVKVVLHSTDEEHRLVRQSPEWLAKKHDFFAAL